MQIDSSRQSLRRSPARLWQDRRGVSALELALLGPLLALLLLGTVDVGGVMQQGLLLRQAVRAGAVYAVQWPTDTTGMSNAITAALPSGMNATVSTPTSSCGCWTSSGGVAAASCTSTCSSGNLQTYVTLSVSKSYSPLLLSSLNSISASNVVRTQ